MVRGGGRSQPLDHHRLPVAVARASELHGLSDFGRAKEKWPDESGHVTRSAWVERSGPVPVYVYLAVEVVAKDLLERVLVIHVDLAEELAPFGSSGLEALD